MAFRHRFVWLAGSVLLTACSAPAPDAPPPPAVLVRTIDGTGAVAPGAVYTGEVRARIEADLGFRIGGKLLERRVDVGARVAAGSVLAVLDAQDAQLAAGAAQAAVAAAGADRALAHSELERALELRARNFISASALDARRSAAQAADARWRQARAQAATAVNQTGYTQLRADADGVVTGVMAEPGQVVGAGQPVLRVARPGAREVLIHLPEGRARALVPGAAAVVRPWAAPDFAYAAQVREVAPAADAATRTYAVRVAVAEADDALPLGATASVVFAGAAGAGVLLPLPAVTREGGEARVWLVGEDDTVSSVAVTVGAWREDGVVVGAGLPARARVVVAGVHKLVAGMAVRAVEEGAPVRLDVRR